MSGMTTKEASHFINVFKAALDGANVNLLFF